MAAVDAVAYLALAIGTIGLVAALAAIVRAQGERALAPLNLLVGAGGIGASAALVVLLPPIEFHAPVLWGLLGGGVVVGLAAGAAVGVWRDARGVLVRGGAWHMLPASVGLLGIQGASVAGSLDWVIVATAATVAAAVFAAAAAGVVLLRGAAARLRPVALARGYPPVAPAFDPRPAFAAMPTYAAPALATPAFAPAGAQPYVTPQSAPMRAPSPVSVPTPAAAPASVRAEVGTCPPTPAGTPANLAPSGAPSVRVSCGRCGAPVGLGWRHCTSCGNPLTWA